MEYTAKKIQELRLKHNFDCTFGCSFFRKEIILRTSVIE